MRKSGAAAQTECEFLLLTQNKFREGIGLLGSACRSAAGKVVYANEKRRHAQIGCRGADRIRICFAYAKQIP